MPSVFALSIFFLIPLLYTVWLYQVNTAVPEPYLDEVFHVRQAQAYCAGKFRSWDPKITTPPGLYLLSYVLFKIKQFIFGRSGCDPVDLRWLNSLVGSLVIPTQLWDLYRQIRLPRQPHQHDEKSIHTVLNICLFPLLFFFSGLYYTDVCSVGFVLGAYQYYLRSLSDSSASTSKNGFKMFVFGLCALLMRQTNIFWVAVFLAGLHAVHHVKGLSLRPAERSTDSSHISRATHDPAVNEAYLEDYITTALSLATTALKDPVSLLLDVRPYLALLAFFFAFVIINGGVVLGDKENHIAGIHIPQMLYIWPYITFFSWPVILPHVVDLLFSDNKSVKSALPRPIIAVSVMAIMAITVYLNTTVHPFTLADNRHYIFYIFKLLLRHRLFKYAAVPVYFICALAAIVALGNGPWTTEKKTAAARQDKIPIDTSLEHKNPRPLRTSFLLIFLASTTLSLVTAPLVEPRYFILPWLIWRLQADPPSTSQPVGPLVRMMPQDPLTWLYVETAWFLLVNLVTCWLFLHKGFEWQQEEGAVQRFLW